MPYQAFPSGDLIVKENAWLEKALPDHTIKWIKFDSDATINTAFVSGSVDLAAIGSSPVARGLSEPLNIPYQVTWVPDVAGDNEALVARDGSDRKDVKDLAGRKVATPFSSTSHYSLLAALEGAGVDAGVDAVGKQLGISSEDAAAQLKQGIFLKPAEQADDKWLGRPGQVGGLAQNLHSAAEFLAGQKQIPAAPELSELEKSGYVEGLSDAVTE